MEIWFATSENVLKFLICNELCQTTSCVSKVRACVLVQYGRSEISWSSKRMTTNDDVCYTYKMRIYENIRYVRQVYFYNYNLQTRKCQ